MILPAQTPLGSIARLVADASLAALSDRVHRGSLANARGAIDEATAAHARAQAMVRELESLRPVRRLAAGG